MQAFSVPVVGVWVSGIAAPTHPLVWLACLKFFVTGQLQDKVTQGNEGFLLLLYTTGQSHAGHVKVCSLRVTVPFLADMRRLSLTLTLYQYNNLGLFQSIQAGWHWRECFCCCCSSDRSRYFVSALVV